MTEQCHDPQPTCILTLSKTQKKGGEKKKRTKLEQNGIDRNTSNRHQDKCTTHTPFSFQIIPVPPPTALQRGDRRPHPSRMRPAGCIIAQRPPITRTKFQIRTTSIPLVLEAMQQNGRLDDAYGRHCRWLFVGRWLARHGPNPIHSLSHCKAIAPHPEKASKSIMKEVH